MNRLRSGNFGRLKFGMRLVMRGQVIRIMPFLTTSCRPYLEVILTSSFSFQLFLFLPLKSDRKRFNGWAVSLFDSLDTMWIMGLRHEFAEAVDSIRYFEFNATKVSNQTQQSNLQNHSNYTCSLITLLLFLKLRSVT